MEWDERFRDGEYPTDPDPSPVLRAHIETFPTGRALDVATGTGRNSLFLAERGYDVDALDFSEEGLRIVRERARETGVEDRIETIHADAETYEFPDNTYDVITISYYKTLDRLSDIKAALNSGGVLFYQHHLRSDPPATVGPRTDRYRLQSNELLRACLDLTVLYYEESTEQVDDRTSATATVISRNTQGGAQSYPARHWDR
ncbi:methylase involved in ubiquinone/menaquinone biosynthesis [Haloferax elongans ATCC BAA-1513]|uniref:Methylase involved in ubiquinone/menaquinone biosynthesis n=1 Tax=Haloferax elongans ATCC BAA-1513 TaxID=1230453 RepID=M0HLS6_HALEO|nr:class I SAM-dependent methyltransferase [Haloferax elongans]ELZ84672.1 methylase involved in ubiquinone/menaquinone biosynthesis [Haloferax elongans ATCC BAA-1513]